MTIIDGLLIFFAIIFLYFIIVLLLIRSGFFKKHNISMMGPAILLRTKKGIGLLKKFASKKRFWKAYGSFGIVFCFIVMIIFVLFFVWNLTIVLGFSPEERAESLPGAEFYLILPGINPIIPIEYLFYIILAFIVAIIVHEFSHGFLTLAQDLKVKSMGILYLIFPIGAFVEPDEEQMKKTQPKKRMRVFAVGPFSNFITFFVCLLFFSFIFMTALHPVATGPEVLKIYEDSAAHNLGIRSGAIITEINGTYFLENESFEEHFNKYVKVVNETHANQTITISWVYNKKEYSDVIVLEDRYNYTGNDFDKGKGYTGIFSLAGIKESLNLLKNPFEEPLYSFFYYLSLPILGYLEGYNPIASPYIESYTIEGPLGAIPPELFWVFVNILYWVAWLNIMVGIFNILPMVPLDGGYLFSDAVRISVKKIKKNVSDETSDKIVSRATLIISLIILFVILAPILLKYI